MSTFQLYERLKLSMPPESAEALANAFDEFSNEIRKTVTQDDFSPEAHRDHDARRIRQF
jgi:hypothetical protein